MDAELAKIIHNSLLIVRGLSKAVEDSWETFGKKQGLSPSHQHILWILQQRPGITVSQLANQGLWHISTATRLLSTLKNRGLIETRHDQRDSRFVYIYLTDEGHKIVNHNSCEALNDPDFLPGIRELWQTDPGQVKHIIELGLFVLEKLQSKQYVDWVKETEPKKIG